MFKFAIYSVYMYLFFKRFAYVVRYFKDLFIAAVSAYAKMLKGIVKMVFMAPSSPSESELGFFKSMSRMFSNLAGLFDSKKPRKSRFKRFLFGVLGQLFKVLSFVYNMFILV
jgi:hypothetical protein